MRRRWAVFILMLLLAGAGGAWWWLRPGPPEPPMPAGLDDPEVRETIVNERQKVLQSPRSATAWAQLGRVLLAHLFPRDADACFAEAARLEPSEPLWLHARGLINNRIAPGTGTALLRQALAAAKRSDDRPAIAMHLAETLLEAGDLEEAEQLFREEQERAPGDARSAYGLGLIARARGDDAAAQKYFAVAQGSPYGRKRSLVQLAALARARGDTRAAADLEHQANSMPADPPWPDPILDSVIGLLSGRRGAARQADALERAQRYAEAAQLYLKRLEKVRTAEDCVGAGINLGRLREYDRALPLLREAVQLAPESAHAHYTLALVLFAQAEREWLEGDKKSAETRTRFEEVIRHARRGAELRPDYARAHMLWGLSLKHLGDPKAAVEPLRRAVASAPDDMEIQLGLGEALLEAGRGKEAEVYLENARRLAPNDHRPTRALERLRAEQGKGPG